MALLPIKDDLKHKHIRFPFVTIGLIVICVLVFLFQLVVDTPDDRISISFGAIPVIVTGQQVLPAVYDVIPSSLTLITSMFLHGGWLHLIFNMLFLWVFGDNVEDAMGHFRFLIFYLLCGVLGTGSHIAMEIGSTSPLIGASGAISGVLGAYLVLHPKSQLLVLFMNFIPMKLPAILVLGAWIGFQFMSLGSESNTAWWAHIGGFCAGMLLVVPFHRKDFVLFDGMGRFGGSPNEVDLQTHRRGSSIIPDAENPFAGRRDSEPFRRGPWEK
jgi:membrane associated rhomboid family serine protease